MSVNEQTSAVFNAFIEADKALKELPAVKAELEEVKAWGSHTAEDLSAERNKTEMLQGTIEALQAELHAKEAALAAATFREGQLSKVVDSIRGALPVVATRDSDVSVTDKANEGQSEAGPTSQGELIGQTHSVNTDALGHSAPTASASSTDTAENTSNVTNPTEATHNTPANPPVESNQSTGNSGGQASAHVDTPNTNSGPSDDNASQREVGPTVAGTEPQPQSVASQTAESAGVAATSNLRYLGHYPHEKPTYLSWSEWDAMGGQTPPWFVRKA